MQIGQLASRPKTGMKVLWGSAIVIVAGAVLLHGNLGGSAADLTPAPAPPHEVRAVEDFEAEPWRGEALARWYKTDPAPKLDSLIWLFPEERGAPNRLDLAAILHTGETHSGRLSRIPLPDPRPGPVDSQLGLRYAGLDTGEPGRPGGGQGGTGGPGGIGSPGTGGPIVGGGAGVSPVPLPAGLVLFGSALAGWLVLGRRRQRSE